MKTIRSIAVAFVFAALFAVSSFAQTTPASGGRIVVIDTAAFADAKNGITKFVNAQNALDNEFKPVQTKLDGMIANYQKLGNEIKTLQEQISKPNSPIKPETVQSKIEEYQRMETAIKRESEDAKANYARRQQAVLGPIMQDIGKAMEDFAKQKGYSVILDSAKLYDAGIILVQGDDKADVTKEFIAFYNSRPSTTATTTPK
jgi:Outer membrane protein